MTEPFTINPADLTLLRASVRVRCSDGTFAVCTPPFICLSLSGAWELHAYGKLQARHPDAGPILACLQRELTEPGWIAYALGASDDPETACASGWERAQAATLAATRATLAAQREAAADDASWRSRRLAQRNPASITLDDLMED